MTARVVRASSLVENLNSRLRTYFFLRRQLGGDYHHQRTGGPKRSHGGVDRH